MQKTCYLVIIRKLIFTKSLNLYPYISTSQKWVVVLQGQNTCRKVWFVHTFKAVRTDLAIVLVLAHPRTDLDMCSYLYSYSYGTCTYQNRPRYVHIPLLL